MVKKLKKIKAKKPKAVKPKVKKTVKAKKPKSIKISGCKTMSGMGSRFLQKDARCKGSLDSELTKKRKRKSRL